VGHTNREYKKNLVPDYCEIPGCEYDIYITKHRIKPGRKGGRYVAGNVIGLCPNHHAEAELGLFSQYELFDIVQRRLKQRTKKKQVRKRRNGFIR
jgi:predicted restriction endonuclease